MVQYKRVFLLLVTGLALLTGRVWADDKPAASTTPAPVAAKPAKSDSPSVTAMKAANALADEGKYDEAVTAYEKMGVMKSKKMEAWRLNNEGLAYLKAKKDAQALPLLEKAVATDAKNAIAWNNMGICYERNGQLEKAKDAYQKSIDAATEANGNAANAQDNLKFLQDKLDKAGAEKGGDAKAAGDAKKK